MPPSASPGGRPAADVSGGRTVEWTAAEVFGYGTPIYIGGFSYEIHKTGQLLVVTLLN